MTKFLNWAGREIDAIEAKLEQLAGRAVTHLDGEAAVLYENHATKWNDDDVILDEANEADVTVQEEPVSEEPDKAPEVEPDGDESEDKSDVEPAAEEVEEPKAKPKKSKKDDA
ncbi:MAG: hypothetical protein KGL39_58985 [Patescibacteria group bacterium]|nr:hypothetical protein [Patescibacteria group bacterium]